MQKVPSRTSRVEAVAEVIRELATQVGNGSRLPTFRELMSELGVSQTTVSAALRLLEAEGLIERRPGSGLYAGLVRAEKPILLLLDAISFVAPTPFWHTLMVSLTDSFRTNPDRLVAEFTPPHLGPRESVPLSKALPTGLWTRLDSNQFSGVIAVCLETRLAKEIQRRGIPMVSFGCYSPNIVSIDQGAMCEMGITELTRLGCRKISIYNSPYASLEDVVGGASSYRHNARFIVPALAFRVRDSELGDQVTLEEHGIKEALRLYGKGSRDVVRPDGIVSIDDTFTHGFLIGLSRCNVKLGEDVKVATHSNVGSPTLAPWEDSLVQLWIDVGGIGKALTAGIECLCKGRVPDRGGWETSMLVEESDGPVRHLLVSPKLRR